MDKPVCDFTMDDLLAELGSQMPEFSQGGALTTTEIADVLGLSRGAVRSRLRKLKLKGSIRVVTKRIVAINDRLSTVTAWAIAVPIPTGGSDDPN